jgi:hypothetical protein
MLIKMIFSPRRIIGCAWHTKHSHRKIEFVSSAADSQIPRDDKTGGIVEAKMFLLRITRTNHSPGRDVKR